MNQRWAEVLYVLAAGSIARLRGDRMSICINLQWIEFDGSQYSFSINSKNCDIHYKYNIEYVGERSSILLVNCLQNVCR